MDNIKPTPANEVQPNPNRSIYPAPFASLMVDRVKRKLADHFGLTNFGVNLTELKPGAMSALKHHHLKQEEFIYVISGTPTLLYGDEEYLMQPGDCFGFKKGQNIGHQLVNRSEEAAVYLEVGDRAEGDQVVYPDDDLLAQFKDDGSWLFTHKDGTPY